MTAVARDLYAATNPAYGSLLIRTFVEEYSTASGRGVPFAMAFIVLPLAFDPRVARACDDRSRRTKFLEWVSQAPEILPGMAQRVRSLRPTTQASLAFGIRHRVLSFSDSSFYKGPPRTLRAPSWSASGDQRVAHLRTARLLGSWLGALDDAPLTFITLGISP